MGENHAEPYFKSFSHAIDRRQTLAATRLTDITRVVQPNLSVCLVTNAGMWNCEPIVLLESMPQSD